MKPLQSFMGHVTRSKWRKFGHPLAKLGILYYFHLKFYMPVSMVLTRHLQPGHHSLRRKEKEFEMGSKIKGAKLEFENNMFSMN